MKKPMSLNEIRKAGIEALAQALGPVGMARFLHQFDTGLGNYTKEREQWLSGMTVQDIVEAIEIGRYKDK